MTAGTISWDQTNPDNIICVVQANGRAQAINGRTVEETQGRIAKVLVSEFGFSQPEADQFADRAREERDRAANETQGHIDRTQRAESAVRYFLGQNSTLRNAVENMTTKVIAAEKERDFVKMARDKALSQLRAAQVALETALSDRQRLADEAAAAAEHRDTPPVEENTDGPETEKQP